MRKWIVRIIGGLFALLLVGLLVSAFIPKPVAVEVGAVSKGDLTVSIDAEGKTRLRERYSIEAPVAGSLLRVEVHPGDAVQAGEALARLEPVPSSLLDPQSRLGAEARLRSAQDARRQARAAVERASVMLRQARQDLERTRVLAANGAAAPQVLERAQLDVATGQSELRSAEFAERVATHEMELAESALRPRGPGPSDPGVVLTSPVEGRVLRVPRESAGTIAAGTPVLEVGDPRALEVVADVLTRDAVSLRPGLKAIISRWGGAQPLAGRVRIVEPAAFTKVSPLGVEEQRVNVVIALETDGPPLERLGDAFAVDVRFVLAEATGVLRIPASAVFRHGGGWATFAVRGGKAALQRVELGAADELQFQLLEGLAEGDAVIVHPGEAVRDGMRVVTLN